MQKLSSAAAGGSPRTSTQPGAQIQRQQPINQKAKLPAVEGDRFVGQCHPFVANTSWKNAVETSPITRSDTSQVSELKSTDPKDIIFAQGLYPCYGILVKNFSTGDVILIDKAIFNWVSMWDIINDQLGEGPKECIFIDFPSCKIRGEYEMTMLKERCHPITISTITPQPSGVEKHWGLYYVRSANQVVVLTNDWNAEIQRFEGFSEGAPIS